MRTNKGFPESKHLPCGTPSLGPCARLHSFCFFETFSHDGYVPTAQEARKKQEKHCISGTTLPLPLSNNGCMPISLQNLQHRLLCTACFTTGTQLSSVYCSHILAVDAGAASGLDCWLGIPGCIRVFHPRAKLRRARHMAYNGTSTHHTPSPKPMPRHMKEGSPIRGSPLCRESSACRGAGGTPRGGGPRRRPWGHRP